MPALAPIPPDTLKRILELSGYELIEEDKYNWVLAKGSDELPVTLPKRGQLVAVDVMMNILDRTKMDNKTYFDLLAEALAEQPAN